MASRKTDWKNKIPLPPLGSGKNNRDKRPEINGFQFKFPIGYLTLMVVLVSLFNYILFRSDNTVVPYSMFKHKIESGEIRRVEMDNNYYTGYPDSQTGQPASPMPATARGERSTRPYRFRTSTLPAFSTARAWSIPLLPGKATPYSPSSSIGSFPLERCSSSGASSEKR